MNKNIIVIEFNTIWDLVIKLCNQIAGYMNIYKVIYKLFFACAFWNNTK